MPAQLDAVTNMCRTLLNSVSECPPCPCKSSDRKCGENDGKDDKCRSLDDGCDVKCDAPAHQLTVGDICRDSIKHNLEKQTCDPSRAKTTPKSKIILSRFRNVGNKRFNRSRLNIISLNSFVLAHHNISLCGATG